MSWSIHLAKNTLKINSAVALVLYESKTDIADAWQDECSFPMLEGIINDGKLVFNPDHLEHMDYISDPVIQRILKAAHVKGDVCFTSDEGDNAGKAWGYRFDGEGGMVRLKHSHRKAQRVWTEVTKKTVPNAAGKKAIRALAERGKLLHVQLGRKIDSEGFDYAIENFSGAIKDKKFQVLVKEYTKARDRLAKYIAKS